MFGITTLRRQSLKTLTSLICSTISKDGAILGERSRYSLSRNAVLVSSTSENCKFDLNGRLGSARWMLSAPRGRSMRSKVEQRMQREAGKTLKEIRRAKRLKLKLKLMTEDERLIYQLRRKLYDLPLLLRRMFCQMIDPNQIDRHVVTWRLLAILLGFLYMISPFQVYS